MSVPKSRYEAIKDEIIENYNNNEITAELRDIMIDCIKYFIGDDADSDNNDKTL